MLPKTRSAIRFLLLAVECRMLSVLYTTTGKGLGLMRPSNMTFCEPRIYWCKYILVDALAQPILHLRMHFLEVDISNEVDGRRPNVVFGVRILQTSVDKSASPIGRLACVAVLDPNREIFWVAQRRQAHARQLVLGRHVVGELAVQPPQLRQDRLGDRLLLGGVAGHIRRQLDHHR